MEPGWRWYFSRWDSVSTERRILVIEDDEDIASALARGLAREGYAPVVAHDLAEAAAVLGVGVFDAAVIDVMLGLDDGRELVRRLRAAGMDAPIVLLSALSGVEDRAADPVSRGRY